MAKLTGVDRVRRMLAIVPLVSSRPDGVPVAELCERFDISAEQLSKDLETVSLVGVAPYTPDLLVDVLFEDDRVWINLPVAFDRPLRLTPDEGLHLLTAGASLLNVSGAEGNEPLRRGLEKIAALLGVEPGDNFAVELGRADEATLRALGDALRDEHQLRLDYYSYGRDEHAVRVVDPHRMWSDAGQWYLSGYCHLAQDERVFRVDRIEKAEVLGSPVEVPAEPSSTSSSFSPGEGTARATIRLSPPARWVLDQYPVEEHEDLEDGGARVTIAVSARPWLERLLLRLGPLGILERADEDLEGAGALAASRVLSRYES